MVFIAIVIISALVAVDRYTKYLAETYLRPIGTIPLIDGLFSLTYVENTGAAFGALQGARWFFVVVTIAVLLFMAVYYFRLPNKTNPYLYVRLCMILIAAGAIGNLIDRIERGYVVDFLHFTLIDFPVFNAADCFVCVGAFGFAFLTIFFIKEEADEL